MLRSQSIFSWTFLISFLLLISACGDDSGRTKEPVTDASNLTELRLSSLVLSAGETVLELTPAFDPDYLGSYSVNVDDDVASINIAAQRMNPETKLEISKIEVKLDANGNPETDDDGVVLIDRFSDAVLVEEGQVDSKNIDEGDNRIALRLAGNNSNAGLIYTVNVHKLNTDAKLVGLDVRNASGELLTLNPVFNPTTMEYTASAAYTDCLVSIRGLSSERHTVLTIAGEPASHAEYQPVEMAVGANVVPVVSAAEDGVGVENYQLTITRASATADELAADATLNSAVLTGAELSTDFRCLISNYAAGINQAAENVQLTVAPAVAGATLRYGQPVFDTSGAVVDLEEAVDIVAGEAFDIGLAGDSALRAVEVTATDGETKKYYQFLYVRRDSNWIEVDTAEALQRALKNAQPNDEIILASALYEGLASEEASGHLEAHFFSDRSGTADGPIILRSENASIPAVLSGDSYTFNAVLQLAGDYWEISGIQFGGAKNGIVLDGANHNVLDGISVNGVGERGVIIRNGSSNNTIRRSAILNTGKEPSASFPQNGEGIVVGSEADEWLTAVPEGAQDEKAYDNNIRNNSFGPNVRAEAVRINEGSLRTNIQHNIVDTRGITSTGDKASAFVVKGNDTNISYNTIYNESGAGLNQVALAQNVVRAWLSDAWGENLKYYQNIHALGGAVVPLANSSDVAVLNVAENTRKDEVEVSYSGSGINEAYAVPNYQLKTIVDPALCFQEERPIPDFSIGETLLERLSNVTVEVCSAASEQKYKLVNMEDGYVFIATVDNLNRIISPAHPSFVSQASSSLVVVDIVEDLKKILPVTNPEEGYYLRWQMVYHDDGVEFLNRGDWFKRFAVTGDTSAGEDVSIELIQDTELQRFELVEQ
ncbi:Right handed beta helix region [Alteromonadaceae bacterium Bs31]|nr:Right handed beta helix region [Alteromonadaceae bacterium Bs31]